MLSKTVIQAAIQRHLDAQDISAAKVLHELALLAFTDVADMPEGFRCSDKIKSLELLGRYLKMWTDKIEHDVTPALQVDLHGLFERAAQRAQRYQPDMARLDDAELETLRELLTKANFTPPEGALN